jgi:alpha-L-rhamnosidase
VAYDLLQQSCPSWLYSITQGATTIGERGDDIRPDGSFQNPDMNSFNHYAYGAIGDWLYTVVAGLRIDEARPGYRHALVQPRPGGGLTYAQATLETGYGRLACHWQLKDNIFALYVTIPANTTATIILPGPQVEEVYEGDQPLIEAEGIKTIQTDHQNTMIEIGSGSYDFSLSLLETGD